MSKMTPDVFSAQKRSEVMSRIRSQGNLDTEVALAKLFRLQRISGWRRQQVIRCKTAGLSASIQTKAALVRPDFVFRKSKIAVFVDGCFWHACPIHSTSPKTNVSFWKSKLLANQERDRRVNHLLKKADWKVVRIWEHELKPQNIAKLTSRLRNIFADLSL
jgi:DNA mismatch endonuclease (patch repair protein)